MTESGDPDHITSDKENILLRVTTSFPGISGRTAGKLRPPASAINDVTKVKTDNEVLRLGGKHRNREKLTM